MMKDNVDKRVVEFEFDNSKFDKNVKKSTKTLDKLDETLQFKDVSKSLDVIERKFSAFGIVAASALKNITDRVINVGIRLVKSLSVDNIASGWEKFGQKTIAVGTLMSQSLKVAGKEIEDYSEKMDIVNSQLEKLNWFTDETSYNFTDMVDNIGKFTAAGQDLDKSVEAMMGIANWAALSGQNATTASRAMYQLSQALGKGYVQLIDWKSIQNANMDTQEFRQVVLDTAVALGELTKEGQNYISKTGKKFTKNQFAEQLNSKWFTSDVLTASLKKYSAAVDKLYEITEKEGITASEAIEKYGDQFDDFAIKAFKAAQEARTFADAINSVKDAVSTGWMNTAEYIFGGYEEAKKFWTDLANELYDVFAESGNVRNSILEVWEALDGRTDLFSKDSDKQGAFWNLYDSIIAVRDVIKEAWNTIFPSSAFDTENDQVKELGHNLKTLTDGWRRATERLKEFLTNNETLRKIFTGLFSVIRVVVEAYELIRYALDPLIYTIKEIGRVLIEFFADISNKFAEASGQTNVFYDAATKVNEILTKIFTTVDIPGILRKVTGSLSSIVDIIKKVYETVSNFFEKYIDIPKFIQSISDGLKTLTSNIKNFFVQLKKTKEVGETPMFGGVQKRSAKKDASNNEDTIMSMITGGFEAEEYVDAIYVLKKFAVTLLTLLTKLYEVILSVIRVTTTIVETVITGLDVLTSFLNKIAEKDEQALSVLKEIAKWTLIAFGVLQVFMLVKNLGWMVSYVKANIFSFLDEITDAMQKRAIADMIASIGFDLLAIAASFLIIIRGIEKIKELQISWDDLGKAGAIFGVLIGAVALLSLTSKIMSNKFKILSDKVKLLGKNEKGLERSYETTNIKQIGSLLLSLGLSFLLIARGMQYFKDFDQEAFDRAMTALWSLAGLCLVIQILNKITSKSADSMRKMLPTFFQMIGFALALKILFKVINTTANSILSMISTNGSLFVISGAIFIALYEMLLIFVVVNNLTKKTNKEAATLSGNTIKLGLSLGVTLTGIGVLLATTALFAYTISQLGKNLQTTMIWVASIVGGILAAVIALQIIINVGSRKLAMAAGAFGIVPATKTVSGVLFGVSSLLLSISVSLFILRKVYENADELTINRMNNLLIGVGIFLAALFAVIITLSAILKNRKNGNKKSFVAAASGIPAILNSISLMLLAIAAVVSILVLLPDFKRVMIVLATLEVFVVSLMIVVAFIASALKNTGNKPIKKAFGVFISVVSILAIMAALIAAVVILQQYDLVQVMFTFELLLSSMKSIIKLMKEMKKINGDNTKASTLAKRILAIVPVLTVMQFVVAAILLLKDIQFTQMLYAVGILSIALTAMIEFAKQYNKLIGANTQSKTILKQLLALVPVLVALTAVVATITLLRDVNIGQMIASMGVVYGALFALFGITKLFGLLSKTEINFGSILKVFAGMGLVTAGILTFAMLLYPISDAIQYFSKTIKPNWEAFGYFAAFLGLFIGLSALVGYLPQIALGMLLVSAGILTALASIGTGMVVLAWGLERLNPQIAKLKSDSIKNLKNLLLWLSLTGLSGILGIVGNSSIGIGMQFLGSGLSNLIGPMNKLTSEGVTNLYQLLLWLSLTGLSGILGIVGNASLGTGMYVLGWGLSNLVGPMNMLTAAGVINLAALLLALSATGITGIFGILGNSSLGTGMEVLGWGLANLVGPMSLLTSDCVDAFANLLYNLSWTGVTGVLAALGGNQALALGMGALGDGLQKLAPSMDSLNKESVGALTELLGAMSKLGFTGILAGIAEKSIGSGMASLADGLSKLGPSLDSVTESRVKGLKSILEVFTSDAFDQFTRPGQGFLHFFGSSDADKIRNAMVSFGDGLKGLFSGLDSVTDIKASALESLNKFMSIISNGYEFDSDVSMISDSVMRLVGLFANINANNKLTLRPVIDMSAFDSGYNRLTGMLNNISGTSFGLTANMASAISSDEERRINRQNAAQTTNNNYSDSYNIVMNIESDNPQEIADELDRILQNKRSSAKAAKGGAY